MTTPEDPFASPQPGQQPPQAGYGPPQQWGAPPGYSAGMPGTNGFAIASLACSVGTVFVGFTCILGIIFGHIARKQIRQTGQGGGGLALAGLIVGYVFVGLGVLFVLVLVAALSGGGRTF
jgi:hypothetical protein